MSDLDSMSDLDNLSGGSDYSNNDPIETEDVILDARREKEKRGKVI